MNSWISAEQEHAPRLPAGLLAPAAGPPRPPRPAAASDREPREVIEQLGMIGPSCSASSQTSNATSSLPARAMHQPHKERSSGSSSAASQPLVDRRGGLVALQPGQRPRVESQRLGIGRRPRSSSAAARQIRRPLPIASLDKPAAPGSPGRAATIQRTRCTRRSAGDAPATSHGDPSPVRRQSRLIASRARSRVGRDRADRRHVDPVAWQSPHDIADCSDIDVLGSIRLFHDELEAGLGLLAHQVADGAVGVGPIVVGDDDAEQAAAGRVEGRLEEQAARASRPGP